MCVCVCVCDNDVCVCVCLLFMSVCFPTFYRRLCQCSTARQSVSLFIYLFFYFLFSVASKWNCLPGKGVRENKVRVKEMYNIPRKIFQEGTEWMNEMNDKFFKKKYKIKQNNPKNSAKDIA